MADNETRFLSKIKLNSVIYNLKDDRLATLLGEHTLEALGAAAWQSVASTITEGVEGLAKATDVKAYVDSQVGKVHNFDVIIDSTGTSSGPSITASEDTMYKIYMVPDAGASAGTYVEWITIKNGDTYTWEKIGSTKTDLTGYVSKDTTIATLKLDHNITVDELSQALGLKALAHKDSATGTVAGQTISGIKATGTTTGSLTGALDYDKTNTTSTGKFTPAGTVAIAKDSVNGVQITGTVSAPQVTVNHNEGTVKSMKTEGTAYSITEGSVSKAKDTTSKFATSGVDAFMDETDLEMLIINTATKADAVTATGGITYTAPVLSGSLPTFEDATVVTGITGTEVSQPQFTGDKFASTFTGTEGNVSVSGEYDKANIGTVAFEGAAVELNVGDITVAEKSVTVS